MKRLISLAFALALIGAASAQTFLRDTFTDSTQYSSNNGATPSSFEPTTEASVIVGMPIVGNGENLDKVGGLFVFQNGDTSPLNDLTGRLFHLRFMFWSGLTDFQADPRRVSPPQSGWMTEFQQPSFQAGWNTPVYAYQDSLGRERKAFWIEVSVASLGIQTTLGTTHFIGLANDGDEIVPGVGGRLKMVNPNGNSIVSGQDWQFRGLTEETKSFSDWGLSTPNVAARVSTTAVPEPGSFLVLGLGVGGAFLRRRKKAK